MNNSSFERQSDASNYAWTVATSSSSGMSAALRTSVAEATPNAVVPYTGLFLLKTYMNNSQVSSNSDASYVGMYQNVYLLQNTTYVFSGWANTRAVGNYGHKGGLALQFRNTSGSVLSESELLNYATTDDVNNGWSRLEVSYKPINTGWYRVYAVQKNAGGYGAFDILQLENSTSNASISCASTSNLVQLGSFELWDGTTADRSQDPYYWTYDTSKATPISSGALSGFSMYIAGKITEKRHATQIIPINKSSNSTYLLSSWGKATSLPDCASAIEMDGDNNGNKHFFGLIAKINYADNTSPDYHYLVFNRLYTDWQYSSATIVPKTRDKTVASIEISTVYDYNVNTALFDNISLVEEPAQTYSYDNNGNLTAVSSTHNNENSYTYSGADLTTENAGGYGTYTYDHDDSTHNLTSASNTYVTMTPSYDTAGNTISTTLNNPSDNDSPFLQSSASYNNSLDYTTSITNANGGYTTFSYDLLGRNISKTVKHSNTTNITTAYEFFTGSNRQSAAEISNVAKLVYGYTSGSLTEFSRHAISSSGSYPWQQYHLVNDVWGNTTSIQVRSSSSTSPSVPTTWSSPVELASYEYAGNNGYLNKMTYANGDYESYAYDRYGRTDTINHYSSANALRYSENYGYDGNGHTTKAVVKNAAGNEIANYRYEYDSLGRLIRSKQFGFSVPSLSTEHQYDNDNRLFRQSYQIGSQVFEETFVYDSVLQTNGTFLGDGSLIEMGTSNGNKLMLSYDTIRRLQTLTAKNGNTTLYSKNYTYRTISGQQTTTQVTDLNYSDFSGAPSFKYTYNADGTIASEGLNSDIAKTYQYDTLGQLISANNAADDLYYNYSYDSAGNILSVNVHGNEHSYDDYSNTYTYGNTRWADLLTAFNGQKISYEGQSYYNGSVYGTAKSGNPLSYYNGIRWTLSWQDGRQLATASKSGTSISYTYDLNSLRTSKTVNGVSHNYTYASGKLLRETYGNVTLDFAYGVNGAPYSMTYTEGTSAPVTYYYITNLQNDVMYMVDASGTMVAEYSYDPYGRVIYCNGSIADINPVRYRGYYYDTETGWYYLQSRYYDPALGRFINADSYASTGQGFLGYNMFAYCGNNPIERIDSGGTGWLSAIVSCVVGVTATLICGGSALDAITAGVAGFVGGFFGGTVYRIISTGYAMISTWAHGGSFEAGLANGAVAYCASWVTGEAILGEAAGEACQAAIDSTIGAGANFCAAGIETGITAKNQRETQPSRSQSTRSEPSYYRETRVLGGGGVRRLALTY